MKRESIRRMPSDTATIADYVFEATITGTPYELSRGPHRFPVTLTFPHWVQLTEDDARLVENRQQLDLERARQIRDDLSAMIAAVESGWTVERCAREVEKLVKAGKIEPKPEGHGWSFPGEKHTRWRTAVEVVTTLHKSIEADADAAEEGVTDGD